MGNDKIELSKKQVKIKVTIFKKKSKDKMRKKKLR